MSDNHLPQHVLDAFWQRWGNNLFMRAQGLEVEIVGVGEAVVRLPQVMATQRGGGGSDTVLNGGVIAYMFDGALADVGRLPAGLFQLVAQVGILAGQAGNLGAQLGILAPGDNEPYAGGHCHEAESAHIDTRLHGNGRVQACQA